MFAICTQTCNNLNISFNFYDKVSSTNSTTLDLLRIDQNKSYAVIANQQTNGRGRSGKNWLSPPDVNLYLSYGFLIPIKQQNALSLTVACAIIDALQIICATTPNMQLGVKWPNDIYLNQRKLSGILLETTNNLCVIGIGINVNMNDKHMKNVEQNITSLKLASNQTFDLDNLASLVISKLYEYLNIHIKHGFTYFKNIWHQYHIWQNLPVKVISSDKQIYGIARGVNDFGALILETTQGLQLIINGDVSLRRA